MKLRMALKTLITIAEGLGVSQILKAPLSQLKKLSQ